MEITASEASVDIDKIAQSLKMGTEKLEPQLEISRIYKVPPYLYSLDKEAYTPKLVSIGPFHHGKPEFKSMETHKLRYLRSFLQRIGTTMEDYIKEVAEIWPLLRLSYVDIPEYDKEKFVEIMAVDGAFLMEFLLVLYNNEHQTNDRMFGRQLLFLNASRDLLLIENQLPFRLLKLLFFLCKESKKVGNGITLTKLAQNFLNKTVNPWTSPITVTISESQILHLLHLFTISMKESQTTERKEGSGVSNPTISELHQAGVKFEPNSTKCIIFSNGVLKIPILKLTDYTEQLFRNLQGFEQGQISYTHVCDYISVMTSLVNNEEDVKILVKNGIIDNCLQNNSAGAMVFNNLSKGNVIWNNSSYTQVIEDLNAYYKIRRHKWKTTLKREYLSSPWTIISVVAAAFLLLLTFIQTVFSILEGV